MVVDRPTAAGLTRPAGTVLGGRFASAVLTAGIRPRA